MDEDKLLVLIGFGIVLVVALNLVMVFSDMFKLGSAPLSGFAVAECKNTVGGVSCGGTTYEIKPQSEACPEGDVPVCTNACELERARVGDDRVCPTYCTEFCLPIKVAEQVLNNKQNY